MFPSYFIKIYEAVKMKDAITGHVFFNIIERHAKSVTI